MQIRYYADGMKISSVSAGHLDKQYVAVISNTKPDFFKIRRDFLDGTPVPKGVNVEYKGRTYKPGERYSLANPAAPEAPAPAKASERPAEAPQTPPTLDMFDHTDPNAPRTMDQNNAFWGLMEALAKLTFKTPEEMKCIIVRNALGENKGTSKMTIEEMDKVIRYVKQTIALFGAKAPTAENGKAAKA